MGRGKKKVLWNRLISFPSLWNEVIPNDGSALNLVQVAIPVADEEDGRWREGQVTVFSRNDPGKNPGFKPDHPALSCRC